MTHPTRTGGQILVDALKIHGVDTAFGVPGESYLDVLDALHDSDIRFVINRQEGGAAFMADAYGKLTGKPGICFVTRGPGATNASIGVHTAYQDSTPMILFIGQVGTDFMDREAFPEIDYPRGARGPQPRGGAKKKKEFGPPPCVRPGGKGGDPDLPRRPHSRIPGAC